MAYTPPTDPSSKQKACPECGENIALEAKKCRVCGAFQGYRRFFTTTQSSLTLLIAVVALVASMSDQFRALGSSARDFITGTKFDYKTQLVEFKTDKITMLVRNRRSSASAVIDVMCFVNLPAVPEELENKIWVENSEAWGQETDVARPERISYLTPVMLRYELIAPEILEPFENELLSFEFVGSLWSSTEIKIADEIPSSLCVLGGAREGNPHSAGASILSSSDVLRLDAVELLRAAEGDETGIYENQRLAILKKVLALRSKRN